MGGIIREMLQRFTPTHIHLGPFLHQFEIQKDFCYDEIKAVFGTDFFERTDDQIRFDFRDATLSVLPQDVILTQDPRNTFKDRALASWRRDQDKEKRNITVISPIV